MINEIRNTITYRYSVFAGILITAISLLYRFVSVDNLIIIIAILAIPLMFWLGIWFLTFDLKKKTELKQISNNKILITFEIIFITIFAIISSILVFGTIALDNYKNFMTSLAITGIYALVALIIAVICRKITSKKN